MTPGLPQDNAEVPSCNSPKVTRPQRQPGCEVKFKLLVWGWDRGVLYQDHNKAIQSGECWCSPFTDFLHVSVTDSVCPCWLQLHSGPMGSLECLSLHTKRLHLCPLPLDLGSSAIAAGMAWVVDEAVLEEVTWLLPGPLSGPLPWATVVGDLVPLAWLWSKDAQSPVSLSTLQVCELNKCWCSFKSLSFEEVCYTATGNWKHLYGSSQTLSFQDIL